MLLIQHKLFGKAQLQVVTILALQSGVQSSLSAVLYLDVGIGRVGQSPLNTID
jgi:hypothetical protein